VPPIVRSTSPVAESTSMIRRSAARAARKYVPRPELSALKGSDNSCEDTECSPTRVTETAPEVATVVSLPSEQAPSSSTIAQMRDLEGMWHLESRGECPAQPGRMFPVGPASISPPRPSCQGSGAGSRRMHEEPPQAAAASSPCRPGALLHHTANRWCRWIAAPNAAGSPPHHT